MHIYIDESGAFMPPPAGRPKGSAVVALVVPSELRDELCKRFGELRYSSGRGAAEVKGSAAAAYEVSQAVDLVRSYDAVFAEGCIIDTGQHTAEDVKALRESQASMLRLRASIDDPDGPDHPVAALLSLRRYSSINNIFLVMSLESHRWN